MHKYTNNSTLNNSNFNRLVPESKPPCLKSTSRTSSRLRVALIGASGYTGLELGRSLLQHPYVDSLTLGTNETIIPLDHWLPETLGREIQCYSVSTLISTASEYDIVFLATPAHVSMEIVPQLLKNSPKIVDLSGAFRLNSSEQFETWYGIKHSSPELLGSALYGLSPFYHNDSSFNYRMGSHGSNPEEQNLNDIRLVANPGCYATAIQMALIPLLRKKLIYQDTIVIDAKSGTTGAGKKATETQLFAEVSENCIPYKVGKHQHYPEFCNHIESLTQITIKPHFSTSLLPIRRGITAGIYAHLKSGYDISHITNAFEEAYSHYPLVRYLPLIESLSSQENFSLLSLRKVVGSARTHISYTVNHDKLYLYSCIDNLMKGAASQAIENMNYLYGWPIHTGLIHREGLT